MPPNPAQHPSLISRRKALAAFSAAAAAGLAACSRPAVSPVPSAAGTTTERPLPKGTPAPAAVEVPPPPPPTPVYVPDYRLPPITDGFAPVISRIPTAHPVVFLTIDDGMVRTPEALALVREYDYPASIFLARTFVEPDPLHFTQFPHSRIQNHTLNHDTQMVYRMGHDQLYGEIAGMQDYVTEHFGRAPTLFRPPGGAYSAAMQQAAAAAGLQAIITWEAKASAGSMQYQAGNALRPGDIVLMHFRPEFADDLNAFRAAQQAAGLDVLLLEDFLNV
ncbi:polysaccharide deacetylase family protein [Arthrobacter koreensis]|uniref:polysaccharide deacetylase family protein n=1 Tax=Arthrobacter koreensis TaxID=199136 RepID=UPI002DB70EC7|nr:polysaccharide deacetylase family protein [Arthrobacter koreensis]MEB7504053.1 polysaccharide deacetylase family protein [Arthrobacter koreensis]